MGSASNLGTVVAWGGFILGFIFGAVANRTHFCTMGAVSDVVNMGSWGRMRMWLDARAAHVSGIFCDHRGIGGHHEVAVLENAARMRGAGALSIEASIGPML